MRKLDFNTILRYALIAGIFLIPFIPFIVAKSMFFPFIVGKNFAFRILVELLFGGWLILLWRDARYRPRFSWIFAAYTLFLGITLVADIFGENLFRSFWSNFERMDGYVGYLHFFAYFLIIGSVLHTENLWRRFFQTTLGASVLMAFYAFAQLAGLIVINQGGARIDATLGNASYLGLYALFHIFIAAFLFVKDQRVPARVFYGVVVILNFVVLYNTATRGAILGLIGGAIIAAALVAIFEKGWGAQRKIALGSILVIVALAGTLVVFRNASFVTSNPVLARIASVARVENVLEEMSASRFRIWEMSWKGFKENPVLGWGQENFNLVFSKYYDPRMYGQEPWFDRAHNVVFDRLVDGGALGFLSYLSIFFAALYCLWRGKRDGKEIFTIFEKSIFTGLLAAYFFQNLFIFDQFISYFLFFSLAAFIHARSIEKTTGEGRERKEFSREDYIFVAAVIIAMGLVVYAVSMSGVSANRALLQSIKPQPEGAEKNLVFFKKALAHDRTVGIMETREQLTQFAATLNAASNVPMEMKGEVFTLARDEIKKQIEIVPKDARYRLFLASLLMSYGAHDETIEVLKEAIPISPKKQQLYLFLGDAYLKKGMLSSALEVFRTVFELTPEVQQLRLMYVAMAVYSGHDELAEDLLKSVPQGEITEPRLINAYMARGQFNKVIAILKERVEKNQNDAQIRLSLAAAYSKAGQREAAIAQIRKVIELAPDFKEQGEYFINEIRAGRNP